jgi:hypothetical protein
MQQGFVHILPTIEIYIKKYKSPLFFFTESLKKLPKMAEKMAENGRCVEKWVNICMSQNGRCVENGQKLANKRPKMGDVWKMAKNGRINGRKWAMCRKMGE